MIGVYDVFSATLASQKFEAIFCSGYGFSASYYGLPDNGYIAWTDLVDYVTRIRAIIPNTHILVDIDDGFGDENIAVNIVKRLEIAGASAIMMEDQKRPKKCGHLDGKSIVPLKDYLRKLETILELCSTMFVLARTDATNFNKGIERVKAFVDLGADAVMIEGLTCIDDVKRIHDVAGDTPIAVNLIKGGKTPLTNLSTLQELGASIAIYSTPCLFSAQKSIVNMLNELSKNDGILSKEIKQVSLKKNIDILERNVFKANKR